MNFDELMIKRCNQLAINGLGNTYPNPMVGSVVVYEGKIIGEGWHQKAGEPHAEVNAINSVKDKSLLAKSTLYVNLEPCSHFGKTPPCADFIIKNGIKKVVIGTIDPFSKVAGNGIKKLQQADCQVITDILKEECQAVNKRFFSFHQKKRPYIFLKWAQTSNGFIAPKEKNQTAPVWISNEFSRQITHKMRTTEQSILVGTNTVLSDNPSLDSRNYWGLNPLRIIIDRNLKIPSDFSVLNDKIKTFVITEKSDFPSLKNTSFFQLNFDENLPQEICNLLYINNLQSLIVEGGSQTLQHFISANLWDEAFVFVGNSEFSSGVKAPFLPNKTLKETQKLANDFLFIYENFSV